PRGIRERRGELDIADEEEEGHWEDKEDFDGGERHETDVAVYVEPTTLVLEKLVER
ncbi:14283_t:CDS:1, partial [Acaulospora colombiana]